MESGLSMPQRNWLKNFTCPRTSETCEEIGTTSMYFVTMWLPHNLGGFCRKVNWNNPDGPRTPYFRAENKPDQPSLELRESSPQPEWPSVERTAADPETGEEYQIALPATPVVKQALLDFEYPSSGIHIRGIAEALADQFALTEEQREARDKYGLVWKRHVNIAANSLVNAGQLLRIKFGWIYQS